MEESNVNLQVPTPVLPEPPSAPAVPSVAPPPVTGPIQPPAPPVPTSEIPPVQPKKSGLLLWVGLILLLVAILGAGGYFLLGNRQGKAAPTPTPTPTLAVTETPTPTVSPTATWKTYLGETVYTKNGTTLFSIKYPADWVLDKTTLYPFGRTTETKILLGAAGHGWAGKIEEKSFPAGIASYSWQNSGTEVSALASFKKNNQTYIFEIQKLPSAKATLVKDNFDLMLSTFQFIEATSSAMPTATPTATPSGSM